MIPHPLSDLASPEMVNIWTDEYNAVLERVFWCDVLDSQIFLGLDVDPQVVRAYQAHIHTLDFASMTARERVTRHDVKARLEEFNELAGHQAIHLGMTSADLVDNVAQIKIKRSCALLATHYPNRFERLHELMDVYPMRGIKGAIGTQQDQIDLLGSVEKAGRLEQALAFQYGFSRVSGSVGQVYHRSLDLAVGTCISSCVLDLVSPYQAVLNGYITMVAGYAGDQWNEGDVTTSSVRRVALPGIFLAADALLLDKEMLTRT